MLSDNILLKTDSYKSSHFLQYPPNTVGMYSYLESRGGRWPKTLFFGLQYLLNRYLSRTITHDMVEQAAHIMLQHGEPFPANGFRHMINKYHGYWPVEIKAVAEGSLVPTSNVLMSIESTDPDLFWVVGYLETMLVRAIWYPTTVATLSYYVKQQILKSLLKTSDDPYNEVLFKLHDFGARGVSSSESAGIGGLAHLVNFRGSDTLEAIAFGADYYGCDMAGYSIPAAEHSTITSWGKSGELDAYSNMIDKFGDGPIYAVVSDSYNYWKALDMWGTVLKDKIKSKNGILVIRPDSGHPPAVVADTLVRLDNLFGHTVNSKGYKVLNSVRVIQGDGLNPEMIDAVIAQYEVLNYSTTNVAFGMGGGLLQQVNRDTLRFAMKCSQIRLADGSYRDVFKDPVGDVGKKSKRGRLDLVIRDGEYITVGHPVPEPSQLHTVYRNGIITKRYTLDEIREKAQ